jgi:hypothetical protein
MPWLANDRQSGTRSQQTKKTPRDTRVPFRFGRQLQQQHRQLVTQPLHALPKHLQLIPAATQRSVMRDPLWDLYAETKTVSGRGGPALIRRALVRAVERRIDLDGVKIRAVILEAGTVGGFWMCARVTPTGCADPDQTFARARCRQRRSFTFRFQVLERRSPSLWERTVASSIAGRDFARNSRITPLSSSGIASGLARRAVEFQRRSKKVEIVGSYGQTTRRRAPRYRGALRTSRYSHWPVSLAQFPPTRHRSHRYPDDVAMASDSSPASVGPFRQPQTLLLRGMV